MLGAIIGDIAGSVYEGQPIKSKDFQILNNACQYTDDTVLTVATADVILNNLDYANIYKEYANLYQGRGYGGRFSTWAYGNNSEPYNSYGNGSAMRVSPIGLALKNQEEVLSEAKKSAEVTHNHPEGIKGAQAVAISIFLARNSATKEEIKSYIQNRFGYNLNRTLKQIRPYYEFDETCQGSVPEAIISFLESNDYEDAIRNAISLGGDSDTLACISGSIAEAFYKEIPIRLIPLLMKLDTNLMIVTKDFYRKFNLSDEYPHVKFLDSLLESRGYHQD